eukprot:scaffold58054_cov75-Phaeocystis_antarctica.AAC.2
MVYSEPIIELEYRWVPPPFCTLVVVVVREGYVRGTLGAICFIARLPPWSPYCALPPGPRSPSMLHPYLSRRAPLPYLGSGPWRSTTHT